MTDLIVAVNENLPIPANSLTTLLGLWSRSRVEFLNWVTTRKGVSAEQVRLNTRRTYEVALGQFFDGIYPQLHEAHEAEMVERGEYRPYGWGCLLQSGCLPLVSSGI